MISQPAARRGTHMLPPKPLSVRLVGLLAFLVLMAMLLGSAGCASEDVETAPAFSLADANGQQVTLDQLLRENRAVVLVFYRGFF
ncbi:MAG: hypothetical protein CMJ45_14120 [Planctomyces sp.]|nr:hypothetical protein [Planctomyces sp.]